VVEVKMLLGTAKTKKALNEGKMTCATTENSSDILMLTIIIMQPKCGQKL